MIALQNISQLYHEYFDTSRDQTPIKGPMADLKDYTVPNVSTTDIASEEAEMSPMEPIPESQLRRSTVIASLEEVIALASEDRVISPTIMPITPCDRLQALVQANRHPPGQRALFAAFDALQPELNHEDAVTGLNLALKLLHGTLEAALDNPSIVQWHYHVREKLTAEYLGLPNKVQAEMPASMR